MVIQSSLPIEPIVVAGAGIIGASIAYHLARRGGAITILDAAHPGSGATAKSLGWINATFSKRPRAYFELNCAGIAGWRRLEAEFQGALRVEWGGSIAWFPSGPEAEELREQVRHHEDWGYEIRRMDAAALRDLEPELAPGTVAMGCHCVQEGAADPIHALKTLLAKAVKCGAEIRYPRAVTGFRITDGRIRSVETTSGSIEAGTVVLACGVDSPPLGRMAGVDLPLKDSPGVLIHTEPARRLIDRVVLAPGVHFKQDPDGRVIAGGPIVAGAGTAITEANVAEAAEIRKLVERYLPALKSVPTERVTLGHRIMPVDEYPILGFSHACQNLYVAATHSGVTLAPVIGEFAAAEILEGIRVDALSDFRPSRFMR